MVLWLRPLGLKASSAVGVFRWSGVCRGWRQGGVGQGAAAGCVEGMTCRYAVGGIQGSGIRVGQCYVDRLCSCCSGLVGVSQLLLMGLSHVVLMPLRIPGDMLR